MSNCINIVHNADINFSLFELDIQKLESFIKICEREVNQDNCVSDNIEGKKKIVWWFLSNTLFKQENIVTIHLQMGRSSHTWRDFKGTLQVLSEYVKIPKRHTFYIADEYDNFKAVEKYEVDLRNPNL